MRFEYKIAFRYLSAKPSDRFMSIVSGFCFLGTTIGVAALIIVMSIMNGFHHELIRCIMGTSGHIIVQGEHPEYLKEEIQKYKFVTDVGFMIEGQGLLGGKSQNTGVMVKGLSLEDFKLKKQLLDNLSGQASDLEKSDSAFIGKELAVTLGLRQGDMVRLIVPQTVSSIFGSLPKSKEFKIAGIMTSGLSDYDAINVIIPIDIAKKLFDSQKVLEVYTDNPSKVDDYTKILHKDLLHDVALISNWQISNSSILSALKIEKTAMSMVLSLIIMVASFNIASSLFMLVQDKRKDIAILRTIGASRKSIMLIFILNGFLISFLGTSAGVFIAARFIDNIESIRKFLESFTGITLFDSAIYFLYTLPARSSLSDMLLVIGISMGTSILASLYPAYRAAKLNPVEILRYE
ncbi:lipoprotein releasing system, transmembrane protein [Candidatus Phycorickettsia trachydisci]|uniref:Lipoprotein releasing system, transmembrane protein n=2 Tax=Candidatus Phycorickettsia trachydisci TaxID=2115978 RepID=A0A2P1P8M6_9RICK|nr:lipoprotein releasing system, transmembrane protein [Candidatus Phycorickettsia trachydisci]